MDLPTYTNIWRIEKRLYKIYDLRLPIPLPIGQIVVFVAITVPYVTALTLIGLPFNHSLFWLYILPPGVATWLATRPVLENKRLPELLTSQIRYLAEPRTWCRLKPAEEADEIMIVARVWHRAQSRTPARQAVHAPSATRAPSAVRAPSARRASSATRPPSVARAPSVALRGSSRGRVRRVGSCGRSAGYRCHARGHGCRRCADGDRLRATGKARRGVRATGSGRPQIGPVGHGASPDRPVGHGASPERPVGYGASPERPMGSWASPDGQGAPLGKHIKPAAAAPSATSASPAVSTPSVPGPRCQARWCQAAGPRPCRPPSRRPSRARVRRRLRRRRRLVGTRIRCGESGQSGDRSARGGQARHPVAVEAEGWRYRRSCHE